MSFLSTWCTLGNQSDEAYVAAAATHACHLCFSCLGVIEALPDSVALGHQKTYQGFLRS